MSVSWTYITRRFLLQNYRDAIAVSIITSFAITKTLTYWSKQSDNRYILVRLLNLIPDSKESTLMMRLMLTSEIRTTRLMLQLEETRQESLLLMSKKPGLRRKESMIFQNYIL